jgi:oligopeptidase B
VVRATTPNLAWATDNQTVFYTKQDLQTLRWEKVYRHKLGADPAKDVPGVPRKRRYFLRRA